MRTPTPEQYADDLSHLAMRLVAAVHDEGPDDIRSAIASFFTIPTPDGISPIVAAMTTLAAMVPPKTSRTDLLGWAERLIPTDSPPMPIEDINALAVEMGLSGRLPAHALADDEVRQVVRELITRGWSEPDIAEHLEAERHDVRRWASTERARMRREAGAA
ncbi:hypothetical protein JOF56_011650 [Kibdelosporangium banguiense]|uniref:Uncharacterized protein n=1 Tax=Kibdelosporangium banguiense TaxID=1365924 RepID=A0ABS4U4X8_9PSEU|nr:hypothetical protein [Kibdelosporangium banguiense]MBP2331265.1 hypothetical protein [Kibdelosporangium banguiense]